ncbi:fucolectin-like [Lissotriton helveticus]
MGREFRVLAGRMEIILYLMLLARVKSQTIQSCKPPPSETNIAKQGIASHSTQFEGKAWAYASLAIDGNTDDVFDHSSCTHTEKQIGPWWRLDLRKTYKISAIKVFNRKDCCPKRLLSAEVRVGDSPNLDNPICGVFSEANIYKPAIFCCNGMEGQYIHIHIPSEVEFLTLCEVEVYEEKKKKTSGPSG